MAKVIEFTNTRVAARRKLVNTSTPQVIEINHKTARIRPTDVFIQCVRQQIACKWLRGKLTRELAAEYQISRKVIEVVVLQEIIKEQPGGERFLRKAVVGGCI